MITAMRSLNAYSYNAIAHSSGASGKLYVPVNPSSVIYAQFNHISGVAAGKGQSGVSISKIQILNTLIENLSRIKNSPIQKQSEVMSDGQVDALIKNYQSQIKVATELAKTAQYSLAGARPESGVLFSLEA